MSDQQIVTLPGNGALFHRKDAADLKTKAELKSKTGPVVSIWSGDIVLPGGQRLQVKANYVERKGHFECEVREFDTWKLVSKFTMPGFAGQNYVDTVMPVDTRKYKLRAIRATSLDDTTGEELTYIRLRMPQVTSVSRSHPAFA